MLKVVEYAPVIIVVMGFFIVCNGAHSIILASNTLYNFPHSDVVRRRVKSIITNKKR